MKKLIKYTVFFAALISLVFLYSCYVSSSFGNSGIRLHLTGDSYSTSSARALGDTSNSTARVYLLDSNNAVFPLGESTEYKESPISSTGKDVTLDNIPAGSGYRVLISIGSLTDGIFLNVTQYGQSEPVSISSGSTADVNIILKSSPFSEYLKGKEIMGVKINPTDNQVYAAGPDSLYKGTDPGSMESKPLPPADPSYEVQSLSIGKVISGTGIIDQVWLNTNKGILPYDGSSFNTNFSKNLIAGSDVTILDSGALDLSITAPVVSVFYQIDGGLGGVYITDSTKDTPGEWNWLNIDLSDVISGQPVSGFYITDNYAYFATKLGAFRLSAEIIKAYNDNVTNIPDLMDYADFFSVTDSKGEIPIVSLAGYTSGSDVYLVIGTERGAYTVKLTESGTDVFAATAAPELVNGTAGYNITKIAALDATHIALLSDRDLFISNGSTVTHYPFNSGLPGTLTPSGKPGKLTDLTWFNSTELLISGTEGLVGITP